MLSLTLNIPSKCSNNALLDTRFFFFVLSIVQCTGFFMRGWSTVSKEIVSHLPHGRFKMKRQRKGTSGNKNKKQVDHHDTVKNYRLWNRCTRFYQPQTACTSTVTGSVFMPIFRFLAGLFLHFCKLIDRVNGVFYFFYTNFSDGDPYNIFFVHQQFF